MSSAISCSEALVAPCVCVGCDILGKHGQAPGCGEGYHKALDYWRADYPAIVTSQDTSTG
jgi:hypothetical protein